MADKGTVTVRPLKHFYGSDERQHFTPEATPFQVSRQRAADLKMNGLVEIMGERQAEPGETSVPQVRMLQHDDGRPNDEPPPESDAPPPGTGVTRSPDGGAMIPPGETNPEPPPEGDVVSPSPGTGVITQTGPAMTVENPDSLIPETPGVVERRDAERTVERRADRRVAPVVPVDESTEALTEDSVPKGTGKRRDR